MGVESKKAIPLPAPTESELQSATPTEAATDLSKATDVSKTDERSHYSLPDDGTPVTIKTRGHKANRSQTSLLIEYFEGGKNSSTGDVTSTTSRKPSVRVRLTPSKTRGKGEHIQITESRSTRKTSLTRRSATSPSRSRGDYDIDDPEDAKSMHSYASATEESNVSRNPIEVEIDSSRPHRRRKVSSPLIPAADSKASSYQPPNMSDISAIPTDSFLDGSGNTTVSREERQSRSPSKGEALAAGALGAVAGAAVAEKMNRKHRSESHERKVMEKAVEKASSSDRKRRPKSRTSSVSEKSVESPRRRSKGHKESVVSAGDASVLSSNLSPSHRSYDSHASSKISINNPKLLETVEDAIRRLILPELDAIKRERSVRESRRSGGRDSLSSVTSASKEDISEKTRRRSGDTTYSKSTDKRNREARNELSPHSSVADYDATREDIHEDVRDLEDSPRHRDGVLAAAAGAALGAGAVALADRSRSRDDEKSQRRRRRARTPGRSQRSRDVDEYEEEHEVVPPMPLSSEINPSEVTRTSILSAATDRPQSASEELTPVHEVARGTTSVEDFVHNTPTPTRTPVGTLQGLGARHANISHGDLKALPRRGLGEYEDEQYEDQQNEYHYPAEHRDDYDEQYDEAGHLAEPGMYEDDQGIEQHGYYGGQDVPAPLRYVPYQQERRGLSPIQSVSGYTEGESEINHHRRDSRTTHSEFSSPDKSPRHERAAYSPNSIPSNMRSREFGEEESDLRNSGLDYRNTQSTDDSELSRSKAGQAVLGLGANPQIVHQPLGAESAVASLIDGSVIEPSVLTGGSGSNGHDYRDSQLTYEDDEEPRHLEMANYMDREMQPAVDSLAQRDSEHHHEVSALSRDHPESASSREFSEFELDEHGRKVPAANYRRSPTASEAAITSAALDRAAAAARRALNRSQDSPSAEASRDEFVGEGVSRNRSFKERAKDGYKLETTPRHSVDRLSEYDRPKMGASGLPIADDPMPEFPYGFEEDDLSVVQEPLGGSQHEADHWHREATPTQEAVLEHERAVTPKASGNVLGISDPAAAAAVGAGVLATAGALAAAHSRQPSQDQEDDWHRTSGERKRDTLVTNPYEGASPNAILPGLDGNILGATGYPADTYRGGFHTGSPGIAGGDEGYISAAPNETREIQGKGKGVGFMDLPSALDDVEDPFYTPKHTRHLSGMSHAMGSPLYDPATGTGIDRIQNKDIIALMEHLMVRDAQRSARDTEILVTLVKTATDMRNSFNQIKSLLADTEDIIITEVKENTEKTVQRHLGGPRPFPGSASRSLATGSQTGTLEDQVAKKRNIFRRALKGLSGKGPNDLGRIEEMLMQLLTDVDVLKHQAVGGQSNGSPLAGESSDNLPVDLPYEQDRGYEPEGNAGTSTASHASQSGHLSIPQSRTSGGKIGYERKFSDHRISTVPEGDEDEYQPPVTTANEYSNPELLMSPAIPTRGGSAPPDTPNEATVQLPETSHSYDNTPKTDEGKKHKSRGSTSFFPKISRWSETTGSSISKVFRGSGTSRKIDPPEDFLQHPPSRSGSDLGNYDYSHPDPYGDDKLHTGYSDANLAEQEFDSPGTPTRSGMVHHPPPATYATPEDPKYKAHRDSLNLQHPQPRAGQTERFRTALESSAQIYDDPMSPRSAEWAGSAVSLNRFPPQEGYQTWNDPAANTQSSPAPPRPPKEPLDSQTPPRNGRMNKLQKKQAPQVHDSGYSAGYQSGGSPRYENRNLNAALGVPTRRPSGPRAMTPTSQRNSGSGMGVGSPSGLSQDGEKDDRRRKRDTFGTIASQESETF